MPIIGWTDGDLLRQKKLEPGIYSAHLSKADVKQSDKGNTNLFLTFTVDQGPFTGKELDLNLSTGNKNSSILGGNQWAPMGRIAFIDAAVKGIAPDQIKPGTTNTDDLMNKSIGLQVGVEVFEGNPVNTILNFLPATAVGAAAGGAVPF